MSDCARFRALFVDAYYQELSPQQQEPFNAHVSTCGSCAAEFQEMAVVLKMMSRRDRQDPGEAFWNGYYSRLQNRILQKSIPKRSTQGWIYRIAAAIAFISIGLVIGKFYFGRPESPSLASVSRGPSFVTQTDARTQRFLDRSQVLLLGIVNLDAGVESDTKELSRERQISHELVREASALKDELRSPRERKLQQLVSDLQIILLQIANLEEREDLQAVQLVKSGVNRKGILLKINLEQMRMADQKFQQASKPKL